MNIKLIPMKKSANVRIKIPGSKSYTNRALILAALSNSKVEIINPLFSDDTLAMISCLKTLGISIDMQSDKITISGNISQVKNKKYILNANLSATTMRFCLALACIIPGVKILTGKDELCKRPIKELVNGLRKLGSKIEYLEKDGFPPVKVTSSSLSPKHTVLDGKISSQFLSAILMIAPRIGKLTINTKNLSSKPYVAMTIDMMEKFGVKVENKNFTMFSISDSQEYKLSKITIEGDFSSATYFAAIAVLTKSKITLLNLNPESLQPDKMFLEILQSMGNKVIKKSNQITVIGKSIKPVNVDMRNCPDAIQTLAVLSSFAKGKTIIKGVATLTHKETDRVKALQSELKKMGIRTKSSKDSLIIFGSNPKASSINTYGDHRMAMAFAVAGSILPGMIIENHEVVTKTFPKFWENIQKLGISVVKVKPTKVVLVGFMGAGKSSLAPLLAKKLQKDVVEMDQLITKASKRASVAEIFKRDGEEKFRKIEEGIAKKLADKKDIIVSTGGGVIMNDKLMKNLKKDSLVIFLDTSFETIKKRLVDVSTRPLWKDETQTKKLFKIRLPLYAKHSDVSVKTDGKSLGAVTNEILEVFEKL